MTKIKILTLKNQAAFDLANKVGKKQSGRFFILVSHKPRIPDSRLCEKDLQYLKLQPPLKLTNIIENREEGQDACQSPPNEKSFTIEKSCGTIYLGLKVSKKMGNAVVRNKIRRRIKHMLRGVAGKLPIEMWESRVFIVIPRRGFDEASFSDIEKDLVWHVKKMSSASVSAQ